MMWKGLFHVGSGEGKWPVGRRKSLTVFVLHLMLNLIRLVTDLG